MTRNRSAGFLLALGFLALAGTRMAQAGINVWTSHGPFGWAVEALAIDPHAPATVYAGTLGGGVFKSTDGGTSWSAVNAGLTDTQVQALAIKSREDTLYAGTLTSGLFKSTDGAMSWSAINTGLTNLDVRALVDLPTPINGPFPVTLYAGTDGGVFKSANGGTGWRKVSKVKHAQALAVALSEPNPPVWAPAYVGTAAGLFKSVNGTTHWTKIKTGKKTGLTNNNIQALTLGVYAGTSGGVFQSTDGGRSWRAVNTGLDDTDVRALAIDPLTPTTLYAGTAVGGAFKSTDGGANWSALNTGLADMDVLALAIDLGDPNILYAGTRSGGVFDIEQVEPTATNHVSLRVGDRRGK